MKIITGNLLDVTSGTILHQVNCMGVTGGLAGALARKYPKAFDAYHRRCRRESVTPLGSFVHAGAWDSGLFSGLLIGHVFGQYEPGPSTDMAAVQQSLHKAAGVVTGSVYAPYKMGCGLGGGDWDEYLDALITVFPDIIIVQRPEDFK